LWKKENHIQTHLGVYAIDPDGYPIYAGRTPAHNALRTAFDAASTPGGLPIINPHTAMETVEKWGYAPSGGLAPAEGGPAQACYPAPWTADPGRTSLGDPLMFNVQINRMLHGSARLKKKHILGADKTGIKRSWNDRMTANLGNIAMFNTSGDDVGNLSAEYLKDAPRDIDMIPGAGIQAVIPQGTDGNLTVAAPQQSSGGLTQGQHQAAMTAALQAHFPLTDGKLLTSDTTAHTHIQDINIPASTSGGGLTQAQMQTAVTKALDQATGIDINTMPTISASIAAGSTLGLSAAAQDTIAGGISVTGAPTHIPVTNPDNVTVGVTSGETVDLASGQTVTVQDALTQAQVQTAVTNALNAATSIDTTTTGELWLGTVTEHQGINTFTVICDNGQLPYDLATNVVQSGVMIMSHPLSSALQNSSSPDELLGSPPGTRVRRANASGSLWYHLV